MSHYKKLYEKIKNNPTNVRFEDIDKLLQKVGGFTLRTPGSGSDHYTYSHPDLVTILTIPKDRPVKKKYVILALQAFDEACEKNF